MGALKESLFAGWPDANLEKQAAAVAALAELIEGPTPGQPDLISEPAIWVHTAFYSYRSGMDDNDPRLPHLAFIEHQFIAALGAMNFDDQMRQLHRAVKAIRAFHRE
jgi:uncharacterized protein involved in propanediol utilization